MKSKKYTRYEFSEKEFLEKMGLEGKKIQFLTTTIGTIILDVEE